MPLDTYVRLVNFTREIRTVRDKKHTITENSWSLTNPIWTLSDATKILRFLEKIPSSS